MAWYDGLASLFDWGGTGALSGSWDFPINWGGGYPTVDLLATSPEVLSGTGASFLAPGAQDAYFMATSPEFVSGTGASLIGSGAAEALRPAGLLDDLGSAAYALPHVGAPSGQGAQGALDRLARAGGAGGGGGGAGGGNLGISMPRIESPVAERIAATPVPQIQTGALSAASPPPSTFTPLNANVPLAQTPADMRALARLLRGEAL